MKVEPEFKVDPRGSERYAQGIAGTIVSRKTEDESGALLHTKEND